MGLTRRQAAAHLDLEVGGERGAKGAERREAHRGVADEGGAITVRILGARRDDGESVVGGRDTSRLDGTTDEIVDE